MVIALNSPRSQTFLIVAVDEANLGRATRAAAKLTSWNMGWHTHGVFGWWNDAFVFCD